MSNNQNLLLASLAPADLARLQPHLRPMQVKQHQVLFEPGDQVNMTYFPTSAIVSLVVSLANGETVETAMVGLDGAVAAGAALDGRVAFSRGVIQLAGDMMACEASAVKAAALQSPALLALLVRHEQTLFAQAQQSAACVANHQIEARLCRWLLRARDLARSDTLMFTQEYLAEMLGVRRTSVTVVANTLQRAGMIKYSRGKIQFLDVQAVQDTACECYSTVKSHYDHLLNSRDKRPG
jgi:CRP-like cAMP-binding protein